MIFQKRLILFTFLTTLLFINAQAQSVTRVALINADTDTEIFNLSNNVDTINIATYPHINFRAITSPEPISSGKVKFEITPPSGAVYVHEEGAAVYACFGDDAGNYKDWASGYGTPPDLSVGLYSLKVTPGSGTAYTSQFYIKSDGTTGGGGTGGAEGPGIGAGEEITVDDGEVNVTGELKQWHKVTLAIGGPTCSEGGSPNPALDYNLSGIFTQGDQTFTVPGYFAADGNAHSTSATSGNVWKIHFAPPTTGVWNYEIVFRNGTNVAIAGDLTAGSAVNPLDGLTGNFTISETDKTGLDLRGKGRLSYVNEHFLQFEGNGQWFLKAGADSPENLLAYEDIDATGDNSSLMKTWSPHITDWTENDPTWGTDKGKGLIGAINYLSNKGMNSISFLTMNINGDDKNVYPYPNKNSQTIFDCSKLDQWEIIFSHAERRGMYLHFKLQETENELVLDNGALGTERKLYYRQLIARFGHHMALNWNIGEESGANFSNTNQNDAQRIACINYISEIDPYGNHIVIHTAPNEYDKIYTPLLGSKSELTGASIQTEWSHVHDVTKTWITKSANAGKKWVVANDEQGNAQVGVPTDNFVAIGSHPDKHGIRKKTLWGNLMAGGAGVEYYFGYGGNVNGSKNNALFNSSDMRCQDFRTRDQSWDYAKIALDFFNLYVPFWEMSNADGITSKSGSYALSKAGEIYVVYLPAGGTTTVDLATGSYTVKWYNPRTGGVLTDGSTPTVLGGDNVSIGAAPDNNDWVVLIRETDFVHEGNKVEWVDCGDPLVMTSFNDFPTFTGISGFSPAYKDNGNQCLAINAAQHKDKFAAAIANFTGSGGKYNITINTLNEYDGESTYKLRVNDVLIGEYQNERVTESGDMSPGSFTWESVDVPENAEIQVEFNSHTNGLIPEDGGTAYSRGRWKSLSFQPLCIGSPGEGGDDDEDFDSDGVLSIKYGENYLVFDAEITDSPLGLWVVRKPGDSPYFDGAINGGYIEFTGNDKNGGAATSPLEYKFTAPKTAAYRLTMRMLQNLQGAEWDKCNDVYVKLAGNFTAGSGSFDKSYLTSFAKLYGRGLDAWGAMVNGDIHIGNSDVRKPLIYNLIEGEEYTLTMAGRAQRTVIDYILFYETSLKLSVGEKIDIATANPEQYRPNPPISLKKHILATDLEVSESDITLGIGETKTITASISPSNASNDTVVWTSSDPTIASVIKGEITAIRKGVVAITAESKENGSINEVIAVEVVNNASVPLFEYSFSGMSVLEVDSYDSDAVDRGEKEWAIDGDPNTFWHTRWENAKDPLPHHIVIDLGQEYPLDKIDYLPRQDQWGPNGAIGEYELYISNSTSDWGTAAAIGAFSWGASPTTDDYKAMRSIVLDKTTTGRYVKLIAKTEAQNDDKKPYTNIAELYFSAQFTGIELTYNDTVMSVGEDIEIDGEIKPYNDVATYPITWKSTNTDVATIDGDGTISAVSQGFTYVVASIMNDAFGDSCLVKVLGDVDTLIGVLSASEELVVDSTIQLSAIAIPDTCKITWESRNNAIAEVSASGLVTASTIGETYIVASIKDGDFADSCLVSVVETSLEFAKANDTLIVGDLSYVEYLLSPSNEEITWSSLNENIAVVVGDGAVIAKNAGNVKIVASILGGTLSDTIAFNISQPMVTISPIAQKMLVGQSINLSAGATPDTSTITWLSSNTDVAVVSESGQVTATGYGIAVVSAGIINNRYKGNSVITVVRPTVKLSHTEKELILEQTFALKASPTPDTCTVKWWSGNDAIATVNQSGIVEAITTGTVDIYASVLHDSIFSICEITVVEPAVEFTVANKTVREGSTTTVNTNVTPQGSTVTYTSLSTGIATVNSAGKVTGVSPGEAIITASIMGGAYTDSMTVTVTKKPSAIETSENISLNIYPNPSNGLFHIDVELTEVSEIYILDLQGRIVNTVEMKDDTTTIDIRHLNNGIYIANVILNNGQSVIMRLVKK